MDKEQKSPLFNRLVIVLPLLGYVVSYYYELGYANTAGIPSEWIEIELKSIIISSFKMVFFVLFALQIGGLFTVPGSGISKIKHPLAWRIRAIAHVIFGTILYFYLFPDLINKKGGWLLPGVFLGYVIFLEMLFPLITEWKQPSYVKKLEEQDKTDAQDPSLLIRLQKAHPELVGFVFFSLLCAGVAYALGRKSAMGQEVFSVLQGNPEYVVLQKYKESLVLAPLERGPAKLNGSIKIMLLSSDQPITVKREKLGKLIKP